MKNSFIPYLFLIFFLILATADGTFIWLASRSYNGTVTDAPYNKGLDYNEVIVQNKRQNALNWSEVLKTNYILLDDNTYRLQVLLTLQNSEKQPLDITRAKIKLVRPANAKYDVTGVMHSSTNNAKEIVFNALKPGLWEIRISAHVEGENYYTSKRIIIK